VKKESILKMGDPDRTPGGSRNPLGLTTRAPGLCEPPFLLAGRIVD
jgi:hypothetical protein